MPPTLEEVVYDQARSALDEQREVVADLRSRAAPVLAGAAAIAALLADPAIDDGLSVGENFLHALLSCIGIIGAIGALVGAILLLAPRRFGFSLDVARLYDSAVADREQPERYLLRLAESMRRRRVANAAGVEALHRLLAIGLIGVSLEIAGFATAVAVH